MNADVIIAIILTTLGGTAIYNGVSYWCKSERPEYSVKKLGRTGAAGGIQLALCFGLTWTEIVDLSPHDSVMIATAAAFGIDNGLKKIGWRVK